jgi:1,2-dihydroxy-3-keto-5-methylthiopentene dioxygenase
MTSGRPAVKNACGSRCLEGRPADVAVILQKPDPGSRPTVCFGQQNTQRMELHLYDIRSPGAAIASTQNLNWIRREGFGLGFAVERWPMLSLGKGDHSLDSAALYKDRIDRFHQQGYQSWDVLHLKAIDPGYESARAKFRREHTHPEDECRFILAGIGIFYIRRFDRVARLTCTPGTFIAIKPDVRHWFDAGPNPAFSVLRVYRNVDGWVADYTDDAIAATFDWPAP